MAGSVNLDDLEDVLSSIRRLVSEDLRPVARPQIVAGPASGPAAAADKLILTPALRVISTRTLTVVPKPAQPADLAPNPMPRLHLGAEHGVARATPDLVASLAQGVDQGRRLDWESETGDPEPDVDGLDWSSFTFARRSMQETFAARVIAAEIVAPLVAHVDRAWTSSIPEAPMVEDVVSDPEDWADLAEAQALANLGAAATQPDCAVSEPEAEVLGGSQQEEDSIFSEHVLRELVRDLIREQLQGDLGERITRNIRKLVRAEISNALAVRKLD